VRRLFLCPGWLDLVPSVVPLLSPTQNPLIRAALAQIGTGPLRDAGVVGDPQIEKGAALLLAHEAATALQHPESDEVAPTTWGSGTCLAPHILRCTCTHTYIQLHYRSGNGQSGTHNNRSGTATAMDGASRPNEEIVEAGRTERTASSCFQCFPSDKSHTKPGAARFCVGKRARGELWATAKINTPPKEGALCRDAEPLVARSFLLFA
jgi:hypothetical protein